VEKSKIKTAIIATGGIDSTVLIYKAVKEGRKPTVITINYGHVAFKKQEELLNYHIKELNLDPLIIIDIEYKDWQKTAGLFTLGYIPQIEDTNDSLRYKEFFIEGRNSIMVLYALAYCSKNKIDELQAGYLYSEEEWNNRRTYKLITGDNSPQFVDIINQLSYLGFSYQVRFRAPYYEERMGKEEVIELGKKLNIDLINKTYSCYFDIPCQTCDNCQLRKKYLGVF
jgi:7-cyano-7-deazaguanine synthase